MIAPNLATGISLVKNVGRYNFGPGSLRELHAHIQARRSIATVNQATPAVVYFIDEYFRDNAFTLDRLHIQPNDYVEFVKTRTEPTTTEIDAATERVRKAGLDRPATIVGVGGGTTLDTAKAIANLLTNGGSAEHYQGWDLVKLPGIHKIGVPTLSGTGAEATRTAVMINPLTGLKLGMNSDHTVFDQLILDPDLTATVPRNQYLYTGMDAYIHCIESLNGAYRNAIGDAYSREAMRLCREVFLDDDMMSAKSRERLMVASYLGGCAIATSYVGVVHPLSAGLSVVLGLHHCVANCVVMRAMEDFYPKAYAEFWEMVERQDVEVPNLVTANLTDEQRCAIYEAAIIHEKPLTNALGPEFRKAFTKERVMALLERM
jgi:3-deoxy-alpha-D-manno-octulosonate 8-oxidase